MQRRHAFVLPFLLLLLLFLAACGHPLAGNWAQQVEGGKKGMQLGFQTAGDKVMVHTPPREDGSHDHLHGTYTFDANSMAVTVQCKLLGDGKPESWTGTLAGKALELSGGGVTLKFAQGGSAH